MKFRRILPVVLTFIIILSLIGCSTQSTVLTGEWKGTVDISAQLTQIPGLQKPPEDITFDLIFVFGDDGSFEAIIDQYSVKLMVDKLLDVVTEALSETAKEKGVSDQELRTILESAVDTDEIVASVQDSLQNGYYQYADGVIYLSAQPNPTAETAQEHLQVTVSGDTLILEQIISDSFQHEQILIGILPLTMEKQ